MHLTRKQSAYIYKALEYPLLTDTKLAELLNIAEPTISNWKQDPEFRAEYDRIINEQGADAIKIAKKTIIDIAEGENKALALQASKYIMDSNGFKAKERISVDANINNIKVSITDD